MTDLTKGWGRKIKLASVPVLLLGLAACATPFRADVSRFQSQLPAPQGESYFVVADDPALAGGLEFAQYADLVEAQMASLGYAQAVSAYVRPGSATPFIRRGTAIVRAPASIARAITAAAGAMAITIRGSVAPKCAATRSTPAVSK